MKILAIETSTSMGSLALMDDKQVYGEEMVFAKKSHSERLLSAIDSLLNRCGFSMENIDVLGVSVGPGSFTGIRVGISTVQALAFAQNKKVVGVSTLEALSLHGRFYTGITCPILDAGRNKVYAAAYGFSKTEASILYLKERLTTPQEFKEDLKNLSMKEPILLIGEGARFFLPFYDDTELFRHGSPSFSLPRASYVGELALSFAKRGFLKNPIDLEPNYLRLTTAEEKSRLELGS